MKLAFWLLIGTLLGCEKITPTPEGAHFHKGYEAYQQQDYRTALWYVQPLADEGHVASLMLLARMHERGEGVKMDDGLAAYLRHRAGQIQGQIKQARAMPVEPTAVLTKPADKPPSAVTEVPKTYSVTEAKTEIRRWTLAWQLGGLLMLLGATGFFVSWRFGSTVFR